MTTINITNCTVSIILDKKESSSNINNPFKNVAKEDIWKSSDFVLSNDNPFKPNVEISETLDRLRNSDHNIKEIASLVEKQ